ncbi:MAG: aspartate kinase [Holosporales bacterium]|jgi:aspartate kinase|nr:aspartate kinase [Holosporales bacterium]
MSLRVLKFGGSSVANAGRIRNVAQIIAEQVRSGHDVVVVTSAMFGVTNKLIELTKEFDDSVFNREYDAVISTGEQVAAGLLALCLNSIGTKAKSLNAWQLPIITTGEFSNASISEVDKSRIFEELGSGCVPVITGFQGISGNGDIYTIGRGGSDATACAVASAINADKCMIYTDVDGVYTADPRVIMLSKRLSHISYDEMIALASNGAQVLQSKSVVIAKQYNVALSVLSSFIDKSGETVITKKTSYLSSNYVVAGIAHNLNAATITLTDQQYDLQDLLEKTKYMSLIPTCEDCSSFVSYRTHLNDIKASLEPAYSLAIDTDVGIVTIAGKGIEVWPMLDEIISACLRSSDVSVKKIYSGIASKSVIVPFQQTVPALAALHRMFFE